MKSAPNSDCNIVALCKTPFGAENTLPCERATNHNTNILKFQKIQDKEYELESITYNDR